MGLITPEPFHYDTKDGIYRLICGDTIMLEANKIAVAFSALQDGSAICQRHGCPDTVSKWLDHTKSQYKSLGLVEFADELKMVVSDKWDVSELNKIIHSDRCLPMFLTDAPLEADFTVVVVGATG